MEYEKEKQILNDVLNKIPMINLPSISRLLGIPLSKARILTFDLELNGFLKREEIKVKINIQRFWKLVNKTNETEKGKENEEGIRKPYTD